MVFGIIVASFARSSVTRSARFTDYSERKIAVWFVLLITVNAWWYRHHIYWLQWTSHKSEGGSITDYSECCWFELQRKGFYWLQWTYGFPIRISHPPFPLALSTPASTDYSERQPMYCWLQWIFHWLQWMFAVYSESFANYSEEHRKRSLSSACAINYRSSLLGISGAILITVNVCRVSPVDADHI